MEALLPKVPASLGGGVCLGVCEPHQEWKVYLAFGLDSIYQQGFCWGVFFSKRLDLSYSSSAALFFRISRGSIFVWISQAAVGEDLIPPEMKHRAWFLTVSRDVFVAVFQRFGRTRL